MPRAELALVQPMRPGVDAPDKREFLLAQAATSGMMDFLYELVPELDGVLIEDVALTPFVDNIIQHNLEREIRGWYPVRDQGVVCDVLAYRNAALNIANSGYTNMAYDTEVHDLGGDFDTSTGLFTAPVDGAYNVEAVASILGLTAADAGVAIFKNGSVLYEGDQKTMTGTYVGTCTADGLHLDKGDTVSGRAAQNDSGALAISTGLDTDRMSVTLERKTWEDIDTAEDKNNFLVLRTTYAHTVSLRVF